MRKRALFLVLLAGLAGCGEPLEKAANERTLAALLEARELYRKADALAAAGDLDGALRALDEITLVQIPQEAPEREDVALDALAEKSRLLLGAGRVLEAERAARRAVAAASRDSYFLGLAWLRLGDALRAQGRAREAVGAFERSIAVNRAVMDRLAREGVES
jgi:tetratricopeptide (TPR) repeat protein